MSSTALRDAASAASGPKLMKNGCVKKSNRKEGSERGERVQERVCGGEL